MGRKPFINRDIELAKTRPRINLVKAMKKAKIENLSQLAEVLKIAYPNVFKIVKPEWNPKFDTLCDMASRMGLKVSDLIDD